MDLEIKRQARKVKHNFEYIFQKSRIPAPYKIKYKALTDFFPYGAAIIETGTYLGETTRVLAKKYHKVITIEPYTPFYTYNSSVFSENPSITILHDTSVIALPPALENLTGIVGFWLDGHYSGPGTYGELATSSPVIDELKAIKAWAAIPGNIAFVAIDDARLFDGNDGYPSIEQMTEIAFEMGLDMTIDYDILFLKP